MLRAEVLIVGGGPAGAACAWALRRHGLNVLILDHATFPRPKLCAGWITPEVLADLELDPGDYPHVLTTVRRLVVSVRGVRLRLPTHQLAIRRVEFDDWLLHRSGARVVHHHVREIAQQDGGYVVDDTFFGRYLVGAGGTHCPVARTLFADVNPRPRKALIVTQEEEFRYPHGSSEPGNACHLWFLEQGLPGYAWYVPKAAGIVNVGVGGKAKTLEDRGQTIQAYWERLVAKMDALSLVQGYEFAPKGHAYYVRQGEPQLRLGNAFVVGDAAGLATSDMGEDIAPAVRSGLLVADAITDDRPIDVGQIRRWSQPRLIGQLLAWAYG